MDCFVAYAPRNDTLLILPEYVLVGGAAYFCALYRIAVGAA